MSWNNHVLHGRQRDKQFQVLGVHPSLFFCFCGKIVLSFSYLKFRHMIPLYIWSTARSLQDNWVIIFRDWFYGWERASGVFTFFIGLLKCLGFSSPTLAVTPVKHLWLMIKRIKIVCLTMIISDYLLNEYPLKVPCFMYNTYDVELNTAAMFWMTEWGEQEFCPFSLQEWAGTSKSMTE